MIQIVNVSEKYDPVGEQTYEVSIVSKVRGTGEPFKDVKAIFKHKRTDGLTVCLQKAAAAVERDRWLKIGKMYADIAEMDK